MSKCTCKVLKVGWSWEQIMNWTQRTLSHKRTKQKDTTAYLLHNALPALLSAHSILKQPHWDHYQSKLLLKMNKWGEVWV